MAVTKIHRTSRIALYITIVITVVITALVLFGGQVPEGQKLVGNVFEPKFLDSMLYWMYILLGITIAVLLAFSLIGLVQSFALKPKKALWSVAMFAAMFAVLLVTYMIGNGTPMNIVGYDGGDNTTVGLKIADMCLYSIYFLFSLVILAILVSPLLSRVNK